MSELLTSEPKARRGVWTDERGTSEEGRRRLKGAPEASEQAGKEGGGSGARRRRARKQSREK